MQPLIPSGILGRTEIRHLTKGMTALHINGKLMMDDSDREKTTNQFALDACHGDILIGGLGIGMLPCALAQKDKVTSITMVESSQEVIDLVWSPVRDFCSETRPELALDLIKSDIFKYRVPTGKTFDSIYIDIWFSVDAAARREQARLRKQFQKHLRHADSFIGFWLEKEVDVVSRIKEQFEVA